MARRSVDAAGSLWAVLVQFYCLILTTVLEKMAGKFLLMDILSVATQSSAHVMFLFIFYSDDMFSIPEIQRAGDGDNSTLLGLNETSRNREAHNWSLLDEYCEYWCTVQGLAE